MTLAMILVLVTVQVLVGECVMVAWVVVRPVALEVVRPFVVVAALTVVWGDVKVLVCLLALHISPFSSGRQPNHYDTLIRKPYNLILSISC